MGVRFHHVCPQWESIVSDQEVWYVSVIVGNGFQRGETECTEAKSRLQARPVEYPSVRRCAIGPHVCPEELVVRVDDAQHYDREETLEVIVQGPALGRLLDGYMFPIDGPTAVWVVPSVLKHLGHISPLVFGLGSPPHLILVLFEDNPTHLRNKERDCVVRDPESIGQVAVTGSRGEEPQRYSKLDAGLQWFSAPTTQKDGQIE